MRNKQENTAATIAAGTHLRPATPYPQPASAWLLVGLLSATATASYLCRVNISVAGILLMREFSLTQIEMGRVFSAFLLGYAMFQVPAGMLADRFGARRVLAGAALCWVAATALMAAVGWGPLAVSASGSLWLLLALRFLLGIGEAPTFPAAARGVASWIPPAKQGRANGLVIAAIGVGSAIAPPLISAIMTRWNWRAAMLVSAAPALGVAAFWLVAGPKHQQPNRHREGAGRSPHGRPVTLAALLRPSFLLLTASYTLQGYVGYIFVFWFYLYLVQVRHFDLLHSGLLGSLPWLLSIVSIPAGGWISDRLAGRWGLTWGRRAVPLAGLTLAGVFLAFGAHTTSAWPAAVSLALATAFVLCVEGPFWATMMEVAGEKSGTAGGAMNMGSNLGGLISPALTPILAARIGWGNALYVAAALSLVAAVLWLGIAPSDESAPDSSDSVERAIRRSEN